MLKYSSTYTGTRHMARYEHSIARILTEMKEMAERIEKLEDEVKILKAKAALPRKLPVTG